MAAENDVSVDRRESFVSKKATEGYGMLFQCLVRETETSNPIDNNIVCAISLETPFDLKQYFSWIAIPSGDNLPMKIYSAHGLKEYLDASWNARCPDPNRILPTLRHMKTRVERYVSLPESVKSIPAAEVNQDLKTELMRKLISTWQEGKRDPELEQAGILLNLNLWFDAGYVHKLDMDAASKMLIENGLHLKSFLIRKSRFSNDGSAGDCTVFTITSVLNPNTTWNVRVLDIHGVGLYCVTKPQDDRVPSFKVADAILNTNNMRQLLDAVRYEPPTYACVVDLLADFADKGYIDLSKMLKVA